MSALPELKLCPLCGEPVCTQLCLDEQEREDEYRRQRDEENAFEDAQARRAEERIEWLSEGW